MKNKRKIYDYSVVFDHDDLWVKELSDVFLKIKVGQLLCILYAGHETERVRMLNQASTFALDRINLGGRKVRFDMWPYGESIIVRCCNM